MLRGNRGRFFSIVFLCFSLTRVLAINSSDAFEKGNTLYEEGNYTQAFDQYSAIDSSGKFSAELYLNMGNCAYKLNWVPEAIYYYEKALQIDPANEDVLHNLKLANKRTVDKLKNKPSVGLLQSFGGIINYPSNFWAWGSITLFFIGFGLLITLIFLKTSTIKRIIFFSGAGIILLGILFIALAEIQDKSQSENEYAILFQPVADLRNEPSEVSNVAFTLHEGTKIKILDQTAEWYKVSFDEDKVGWIAKSTLKTI